MDYYENSALGGDIWSNEAFSFESSLKDTLDKGNFSLHDLLEEDELLQELRGLHPQLVSYFSSEESVTGLVKCMLESPPPIYNNEDTSAGIRNRSSNNVSSISNLSEEKRENCNHDEGTGDINELPSNKTEQKDHQNGSFSNNWHQITGASNERDQQDESFSQVDYDRVYIRYPYMACEVICCEVESILDIFVEGCVLTKKDADSVDNVNDDVEEGNECIISKSENAESPQSILDFFFTLLSVTSPSDLDDRRAGYLEKILTVLFRKKNKAIEAYINGDHFPSLRSSVSSPLLHESTFEDIDNDDKKHIENKGISKTALNKNNHRGGGTLLLRSFFRHLHSNSIMQIVQRLLTPFVPLSAIKEENEENRDDPPRSSFGEEEDDEGKDEDGSTPSNMAEMGLINCNWAENDVAIELLILQLVIDRLDDHADGNEEGMFDSSQHASEILLSMIQNSDLFSTTMKVLSRDPAIGKIICSACGQKGSPSSSSNQINRTPERLSFNESTMTASLRVLESLIIQFGNCGIIATINENNLTKKESHKSEEIHRAGQEFNAMKINDVKNQSQSQHEEGTAVINCASFAKFDTRDVILPTSEQKGETYKYATTSCLIYHLPYLLDSLSSLLKHSDTPTWKINVQYSTQPQNRVGQSRLSIVRLIESLVLLKIKEIDNVLFKSSSLEICLDLFWEFKWCSLLHESVTNLLVNILEGGEDRVELQQYILNRCVLPQKLMEAFYNDSFLLYNESGIENIVKKNELELAASTTSFDLKSRSFGLDSDDHESDIIPVSDDDVESLLEHQEQFDADNKVAVELSQTCVESCQRQKSKHEPEQKKVEYLPITGIEDVSSICIEQIRKKNEMINESTHVLINGTISTNGHPSILSPTEKSPSHQNSFKSGYMGHVIIICQTIVRLCENNHYKKKENNTNGIAIKGTGINEGLCSATNGVIESSTDMSEDIEYSRKRKFHPPTSSHNDKSDISDPQVLLKLDNSADKEFKNVQISIHDKNSDPSLACYHFIKNQKSISDILQCHILYPQWKIFVSTLLAEEEIRQNTALGCCNNNVVLEKNAIVLGETDLDTAASMMESLSFPTSTALHTQKETTESEIGDSSNSIETSSNDKTNQCDGAAFGTVVQMNLDVGQYYYDDPLGGGQCFDNNAENIEEKRSPRSTVNNTYSEQDEEEDDVPVMDLFAGNVVFDENLRSKQIEDTCDDKSAWANFDNAFVSQKGDPDPTFVDFNTDFENSALDLFDSSSTSNVFDSSTDLFRNVNDVISEDLFNVNEHSSTEIVGSIVKNDEDLFSETKDSSLVNKSIEC